MRIDTSLAALRSQIRALRPNLARPLTQPRIQRMADEICLKWSRSQGRLPEARHVFRALLPWAEYCPQLAP